MTIYIVIPAHNEAKFIELTLKSLAQQTLRPKKVVVVNDNSTDHTEAVVNRFSKQHSWISLVNTTSTNNHIPGAKVINAFYKGFETLDNNYDIICKFDADLIFPKNYLHTLTSHFTKNNRLGMCAGFCYIKKGSDWIIENLTNKNHIRGALKAYRKACFIEIGQLKKTMGWDTADELLAQYYGWSLKTDENLKVKHLKPTGTNYNTSSKYLQGQALYKLRFRFWLAFLSALKLAYKKKSVRLFRHYIIGYLHAFFTSEDFMISKAQGAFVRKLRWQGIYNKLLK